MSTPAITIANWKGEPVQVVASKGGVLAALSPFDNLIKGGVEPWPPPEIVQRFREPGEGRLRVRQEVECLLGREAEEDGGPGHGSG